MSSVWNLLNPIRNGGTGMKLLGSGRELFGTVIRSGKMDKTVTVIHSLFSLFSMIANHQKNNHINPFINLKGCLFQRNPLIILLSMFLA